MWLCGELSGEVGFIVVGFIEVGFIVVVSRYVAKHSPCSVGSMGHPVFSDEETEADSGTCPKAEV